MFVPEYLDVMITITGKSCFNAIKYQFYSLFNTGNHYHYSIDNSHNPIQLQQLGNAAFESYRVKRDTNSPPSPVSSSASSSSTTSAPTSPTVPDKGKTDAPESTQEHLLGENGAGQRKYFANGTKITPDSLSSDSETLTINKSLQLGAVAQATKPVEAEATDNEDIEKLIGTIDEPEEAINKTITDELTNSTKKVDYFQYYNSTTVVDKNKSEEYWSEKKEYTVSNILSRSHRRAIVSATPCATVYF